MRTIYFAAEEDMLGFAENHHWLEVLRYNVRTNRNMMFVVILNAFTKLRKANVSSQCLSVKAVRPSVHMEHLGSHSKDLHEILNLIIFRENTVLKRNGNNEYCK
jgi:hypothetical protein